MALDALIAVIDQLRERMEAHKTDLRQSEAMTRYVLIDPLLAALGWDTSDPSQVRPEYKTGTKRADYALLKADGKPFVFVEAKSLDKALSEGLDQGIILLCEDGHALLRRHQRARVGPLRCLPSGTRRGGGETGRWLRYLGDSLRGSLHRFGFALEAPSS